jgi:hypothetical protein
MSVNKDITEFEEKVLRLVIDNIDHGEFYFDFTDEKFIADLRQIMPPTCTETERKFLDRVREDFCAINDTIQSIGAGASGEIYCLYQSDFPDIDLKELVE